jgi:hypothetical protein
MAYTPYEHLTTDEYLVVIRGKCPFHMCVKSKPVKYGIKLWVAADAKHVYTCNMQVYTGNRGGVRKRSRDVEL